MITIRPATPDDAAAFLALRQQVDLETKFMMLEPGERQTTVEQERERLAAIDKSDNQQTFLAEDNGQLVGWLWANGGSYRRNHHNVHIVIGIRAAFTNQGIGTRLVSSLRRLGAAARPAPAGTHRDDAQSTGHRACTRRWALPSKALRGMRCWSMATMLISITMSKLL